MELETKGIKVLSAQDLESFYEKTMPTTNTSNKVNIYDLVEWFIGCHPNGSFFLDEVPLLKDYVGK